MGQGPVWVTRKTTGVHYWNAGVYQNEMHTEIENEGVQDNSGVQYNTNTPNNDHNDPKNYPIIKIENTTDATEDN